MVAAAVSARSSTAGWSVCRCCSRSRWRRRRVDRVDQLLLGGRLEVGPRPPAPTRAGRRRAGRDRADGHRRQPRARLPVPGRVLRRAHGARPRGRRGGDPQRIAEPLGVSVVEAAALIRRIIDDKMASAIRKEVTCAATGHGVHALRLRRRRAHPRRRLHGGSARGDVPVLAGVLRVRLLDHGRRPPLRALPADDAAGAVDGRAGGRSRGVQRDGQGDDGRGAARGRVRGPELGGRDRQPRARHALRRADPLQAGVLTAAVLESEDDARAVYERFEQEFSEAFSPLAVNVPGGVYIDTFVLRVAIPGQKLELPELELTSEEPAPVGSRQA